MDKEMLSDIKRLLQDGLDCGDWKCVEDALDALDEVLCDEPSDIDEEDEWN